MHTTIASSGAREFSMESSQEIELMNEKRETRRGCIKTELFETEKAYIRHLQLVHKYFDFPLRFNCLITDRTHTHIFSNIEQISEVNRHLLSHMEQGTVGSAFLYLSPFLKLYSTYANNHELALENLQECVEKEAKFAEFLRTQENRPELGGLKLNALLITPVQRIPRYKLLLEDLLHNTPPSHHDYSDLSEAVDKMSELATYINEQIRHHAHFHKMLAIQKSLVGPAPKLLAPGRGFIRHGMLKKISRRGRRLQERMFYLFTDMLLYAKARSGETETFTCCAVYPLRYCCVQQLFGNYTKHVVSTGVVFKVTCRDESVLVYSADCSTGQAWFDDILLAIREINISNRNSVRMSSRRRPNICDDMIGVHKRQKLEAMSEPCRQPLRRPLQVLKATCMSPRRCRVFHTTCSGQSHCPSPYRRRLLDQIHHLEPADYSGLENPGETINESLEASQYSTNQNRDPPQSSHTSHDGSMSEEYSDRTNASNTISDRSFTSDSDIQSDFSSSSRKRDSSEKNEGKCSYLRNNHDDSTVDKENRFYNVEDISQSEEDTNDSKANESVLSNNYDIDLRREIKEKYLIQANESRTSYVDDYDDRAEGDVSRTAIGESVQDSFVLVDEGLSSDNLNFSLDMFSERAGNTGGVRGAECERRDSYKLARCEASYHDSEGHRASTLSRVSQTLHNSLDQLRSVGRDNCVLQ